MEKIKIKLNLCLVLYAMFVAMSLRAIFPDMDFLPYLALTSVLYCVGVVLYELLKGHVEIEVVW